MLDSGNEKIYELRTTATGPTGKLPFADELLKTAASGDLFGWTQNAGMGWNPDDMRRPNFVILSTQGGIRRPDGSPVALGYHTGHWEVGLLMEQAARTIALQGGIPFAGFCSDPCDGRTQGTLGMFDSLAYRNDAAIIFRRLVRSLPTAKGVVGVATCDKGLPAMMMALAGLKHLPSILVPGGVTLLSQDAEDLGKIQSIGPRYAHGEISLTEAAELGCKACGTPGGGCQFLGTAATSQVVGEALGMSLPHSALSPSGAEIWLDLAARSGRAVTDLHRANLTSADILTDKSIENALVTHAAFGGSTNLIIHIPAIAHAAGLRRPDVNDWQRVNARVPRLVDALPNGPHGYATVQVFLAGGVPEVMLHLRQLGLLNLDVMTVSGQTLGENLDWWEKSERRSRLKEKLMQLDGIDATDVIRNPENGFHSTVTFPVGNLTPDGSVIKSTAIDVSVIDDDGVYRHTGPARVFCSEADAIASVKSTGDDRIQKGDVMVLSGIGAVGAGMPETAQITIALKYLPYGKHVALITDGRFSGVSTGPCIGHISPEAMAGGRIGKVRDGDRITIEVDTINLTGSVDFDGDLDQLDARQLHPGLQQHPDLPDDTRLWAALQQVSGGTWGGCVYDVDAITKKLHEKQ
jgi:putative YjhG/YagF family dehydratase